MNTKNLIFLLNISFLSSTTVLQAMENEKIDHFFTNNTNCSMQIQSVINRHQKYTDLIIDNVNGGITSWYGRTTVSDPGIKKDIDLFLKGTNNLGACLAYISVQNNGHALLAEPQLKMEVINGDPKSESPCKLNFDIKTRIVLKKHILILNGNELWNNITIIADKSSVQTTGFQQCKLRLNHES